ncbi:MAG: hypothetical protein WBB67_12670 [bacterium]
MDKRNTEKENPEPDMSGRGSDLLDTMQMIQNKQIHEGYFEAEIVLKHSATFGYPVVFKIQDSGSSLETIAITFDTSQPDKTKQLVEEKFIVPQVCKNMTRDSIVDYFTDIVEKDGNFALYINKRPLECENLTFYRMTDDQKVIFSEYLVMRIIKILDERKRIKQTHGL